MGFLLCARTLLKLTKIQGFSTFLDAKREFLHAVFTTMRYFYCKNRKEERSDSLCSTKLRSQDFQTMHFLCLKTPQITGFLHRVSPRLPESAAKVAVSVLWVCYA